MTSSRPRRLTRMLLGAVLGMLVLDAQADTTPQSVTLGYVALSDDPRYRHQGSYTGIEHRTLGRPLAGAQVGLEDARAVGNFAGYDFQLQQQRAPTAKALAETVRGWTREASIHLVLTDLPAEALLALADAVADLPVLLLNVSAPDDALRGTACRRNVAHTYPSHAMLTDALAQYLAQRRWREVLVVNSSAEPDTRFAAAFQRSAAKFDLEVVAQKRFQLSQNPEDREHNNPALLTNGEQYDTLFVADASGEFGRYLPYRTALPRPVVGSAGLMPVAWHWSWYRHGAPQLQHRFEDAAPPRRMNSAAWAAWVAIKAVTEAVLRAESSQFTAIRAALFNEALAIDGVKGNPASFRPWNQQLRQPLLLATPEAVIARAPLAGFEHRTNVLDTLGVDAPESDCQLAKAENG